MLKFLIFTPQQQFVIDEIGHLSFWPYDETKSIEKLNVQLKSNLCFGIPKEHIFTVLYQLHDEEFYTDEQWLQLLSYCESRGLKLPLKG